MKTTRIYTGPNYAVDVQGCALIITRARDSADTCDQDQTAYSEITSLIEYHEERDTTEHIDHALSAYDDVMDAPPEDYAEATFTQRYYRNRRTEIKGINVWAKTYADPSDGTAYNTVIVYVNGSPTEKAPVKAGSDVNERAHEILIRLGFFNEDRSLVYNRDTLRQRCKEKKIFFTSHTDPVTRREDL